MKNIMGKKDLIHNTKKKPKMSRNKSIGKCTSPMKRMLKCHCAYDGT